MNDLDTDYINEYNLLETNYNKFYKAEVKEITLNFIYVNEMKEIYNIKTKQERISESCLKKERLLYLIKNNQYNLSDKHRLVDLLSFNINIEPSEISDMILKNNDNKIFLKSLKIIDDIKYHDTIKMLQKQNSLIFILIKSSRSDINTRRIHLKPRKKTRRKQ